MASPLGLTPTAKSLVFEFVQTGYKVGSGKNVSTVFRKNLLAITVLAQMEWVVPITFVEFGEGASNVGVKGFFADVDDASHFLQFSVSMNPVAKRRRIINVAEAPSLTNSASMGGKMLCTNRFITHEKKKAMAKNATVVETCLTLILMHHISQETQQKMNNIERFPIQSIG